MKHQKGFTLLEVMIVVAVIAILSTFAIPSYNQYVTKARRSDAKTALLKLAQLQEAYFSNNNRYATTLSELFASKTASDGFVEINGTTARTQQGFYKIELRSGAVATRGFTVAAIPSTDMAAREADLSVNCKGFLLDSTGQQSVENSTGSVQDCWN